jgi:hypothetical protein
MASEGSDVQLPCTSRGNPSLITTKWLWNGKHLPKLSNAVIFPNGTLYLRNVNTDHEGVYKCAPFNKIGLGNSAETILKVEGMYVVVLFCFSFRFVSLRPFSTRRDFPRGEEFLFVFSN